jgi:hypothetical protein
MEEDFGGGQGLTKGCGAKGIRRRKFGEEYVFLYILLLPGSQARIL